MSEESTRYREPNESELELLEKLAALAADLTSNWLDGLRVAAMEDGGMGSLKLLPNGITEAGRQFGKRVAECQFNDVDGVAVLVSLNVDQQGMPFELDVWRTDFNPRLRT